MRLFAVLLVVAAALPGLARGDLNSGALLVFEDLTRADVAVLPKKLRTALVDRLLPHSATAARAGT